MRARASLFFQTLIQCLTHMNINSIFIFTTSFLIYLCALQAKIPQCNCISVNRGSEMCPHSGSVHLCLSSNTVSSPGEGPQNYGPNCCKCGCRFSWTTGTSYPKLCEFAERPVTAEPFTTAWIMRQRPRSSVYNLEAERVNLNPGAAQADLPVPTKGGRK